MEETGMCYPIAATPAFQQAIPNSCPAKTLPPSARLQIGLNALIRTQSVTDLAAEAEVSRKFVYQQSAIADQALLQAFAPKPADDQEVLFCVPVTKAWLRQLVLALVLICHSPLRGVVELLRDLFDYDLSLGSVFNIVAAAVHTARKHNETQDLSRVRVGAHDEIFQARRPVVVGVDAHSSYCYLLSLEEHRDAETWGVRLLELQQRGFDPDYVVADAGRALRAAQAEILPQTPCYSDVFHALQEVSKVATKLENAAYRQLNHQAELERKIARAKQHMRRPNASWVKQLYDATKKPTQAVDLADDVALLERWLHFDVLALAGPTHAQRCALYDFIVAELSARIAQAPTLLRPLVTYLQGQRDNLLAFAAQLDHDLAALATRFGVAPEVARALFAVQSLPAEHPQRWQDDAPLRRLLGRHYFPLSQALEELRDRTVRASSVVENLNSRLRSYFFLRRHLGNDYLSLLQFFLNHRRFPRSERLQRVGKSPAESLTGQSHPHWLEMLGHTRFSRN
jgi:hypothetical protein